MLSLAELAGLACGDAASIVSYLDAATIVVLILTLMGIGFTTAMALLSQKLV